MAELRAAVDQGGEGDVINLSPGVYLVDSPLELKAGMELVGQNRYVELPDGTREVIPGTATILDGSLVAPTPGTLITDCEAPAGTFSAPRGVIEDAGHDNRISGMSIRSAAGIGVRYALTPGDGEGLSLVIRDSLFENSRLGIAFLNAGCAMSGATSTIVVERSVFTGNGRGIANFNLLADRAVIDATYRDNVFVGNDTGVQLGGGSYGSDDSGMFIASSGNRYVSNTSGLVLLNGWHGTTGLKASDGNLLHLTSSRDSSIGNAVGLQVRNALITSSDAVPSSENRIRLDILAGTFAGNGQNLNAMAWTDARPGQPATVGMANTVALLIRETSSSGPATFAICDGSPTEPSNRVILLGSPNALANSNDGVDIVRCSG
jgi:hypothetical protein